MFMLMPMLMPMLMLMLVLMFEFVPRNEYVATNKWRMRKLIRYETPM